MIAVIFFSWRNRVVKPQTNLEIVQWPVLQNQLNKCRTSTQKSKSKSNSILKTSFMKYHNEISANGLQGLLVKTRLGCKCPMFFIVSHKNFPGFDRIPTRMSGFDVGFLLKSAAHKIFVLHQAHSISMELNYSRQVIYPAGLISYFLSFFSIGY